MNVQQFESLFASSHVRDRIALELKTKPRVKICCIASIDEARSAIARGASALGLVSSMPSGPGVISEETIAEVARQIPPPIATFLLTCATSADAIIAQQRRCFTNTLQLCDYVETSVYRELRRELPGVGLVQVIHVTGPESVDLARACGRTCSGIAARFRQYFSRDQRTGRNRTDAQLGNEPSYSRNLWCACLSGRWTEFRKCCKGRCHG